MNRYQRRKYGSTLPKKPAPSPRRFLIYVVALLLVLGVLYFRVVIHR